MHRYRIFIVLYILISPVFATTQIDPFVKESLVAQIEQAREPRIIDKYAVFTADGSARFTGIVFDYENYRTIHPFSRIVNRTDDGRELNSVLFYIVELPEHISAIKYRIIVDGLWTTDPMNTLKVFDSQAGIYLSSLTFSPRKEFKTATVPGNMTHFVYEGLPGQTLRLAGSFNGWDSFMYEMRETSPGIYQIDIPLPPGTYFYAFFSGTNQFGDAKNPDRRYTADGKTASVITVPQSSASR